LFQGGITKHDKSTRGGYKMRLIRADIDQLLQDTLELASCISEWNIKNIEIDDLLEDTKNWN